MTILPVEELLAPLSDTAPCGADLEYDAAFLALQDAAQGKPEQQFGDTVIAAKSPTGAPCSTQALALARRTRDLRLAVLLARCRRAPARSGVLMPTRLSLIAGLLERHWDGVYPQLDADAGNDPTMRLNALAPLAADSAGLADLRAAAIGAAARRVDGAPGRAGLRQGRAPRPDESQPTARGRACRRWRPPRPALRSCRHCCVGTQADLLRIEAADRSTSAVAAQGPELRRDLRRLVQTLADAATRCKAWPQLPHGSEAGPTWRLRRRRWPAARSSTRDDVLEALDRVCDWIEQHEPTNPAPLLIRRAQRLMSKNFIDIIRDLVPDGIDQVEKIAGSTSQA